MRKSIAVSILAAAGLVWPAALRAEPALPWPIGLPTPSVYFVQSATAQVRSGPSFSAPVLGEVGRGERLFSFSETGSWVKVWFKWREGYVPAIVLAMHPPFPKAGVAKAAKESPRQMARRRLSAVSAAPERGPVRPDQSRPPADEKAAYAALERAEALGATPEELARFMAAPAR